MNFHTRDFFDQARDIHIKTVATQLGLTISRHQNSAGPCPVCDRLTRSQKRKDKRLPIGFRGDGKGWECQHCHEKGDGIELVAYSLGQARFRQLPSYAQAEIFDWYYDQGLITRPNRTKSNQPFYKPPPLPPLATLRKPSPELPTHQQENPNYPPPEQVQALWNASRPVCKDSQVSTMLQHRGIDPDLIGWLDLARALPVDGPRYSWTKARNIWWHQGWRLILPAFDHKGQLKSLKARWIHKQAAPANAKSVSPKGYQIKHLLLADLAGHPLLEQASLPACWPAQSTFRLWIVEGDMDFLGLCHATIKQKLPCQAIWGIWPGSFAHAFASQLPLDERLHITIATDPDQAGDTYAAHITKTLLDHQFNSSQINRWKP